MVGIGHLLFSEVHDIPPQVIDSDLLDMRSQPSGLYIARELAQVTAVRANRMLAPTFCAAAEEELLYGLLESHFVTSAQV